MTVRTGLLAGLCSLPLILAHPAVAQEGGSKHVNPYEQDDTQAEHVDDSLEGARYVAMGSSFAAGPKLPPAKPGAPVRCGQSLSNYPTLLAERYGMVLVDRTCSGATTDHLLGPWGQIPPQLDSLTPETKLVTITIGGNDLSYIGNLFSATCAFNAKALAASGTPTRACNAVRVPNNADYARTEMQMHEIVRQVRRRAPQARLVFVQYLTPLPAQDLCADTPVSRTNARITREIGRRLAEITERVAYQRGALVVEMQLASVNHTPCDEEPWMIGSPQGYDGSEGLQWHLNKAGMKATADGITYWLIESGLAPGEERVPFPGSQVATSAEPAASRRQTTPSNTSAPLDNVPAGKAEGRSKNR